MALNTENSHSFFGVFIDDVTQSVNLTKYNIFEEVDLFYQPIETPLVASVFFLDRMIVVFISENVNVKVYSSTPTIYKNRPFYLYVLLMMLQ